MSNYNLGTAEGLIRIKYDGDGAKKAQVDLDKTGKVGEKSNLALNQTSRNAAIGAAVLGGALVLVAAKAVDFEKQVSAIGAVSGASQAQLEQLRAKALKLGADTVFSASQAANAMEELAKAGVSVTDILGGAADATVALAAAGGIALPEAATIAANAMNAFNLSAKDLPKVADLIAGAANASAIDVSQFGQSLQQAGAVAKLAGLPFSDLAVAIAEMGNAGIKGSDAGTSLKTFLQNLIPQTKQQVALFKQLGLETKAGGNAFFDASGKVKSLADISQILQNALRGQSKEQQLATLQTLFGSDAIRAAAILASNGSAGFNTLAAAMGKVTAQGVAAARLNNTAGQIEQLKGSAETAAIAFGTALLPTLLSTARALTTFANALSSLPQGAIQTILAIIAAVTGLLVIVSITTKIVAAFRAVAVAWEVLNVAFLFSPIGLVILAIVALVAIFVVLWLKFSWFRDFWIAAWNDVKAIALAVGAWFAGPFANFFVAAWDWIVNAFNVAKNAVMTVINLLVAGFMFWFNIVKSVLNFFAPLFSAVFGLIAAIVTTAFNIISAIFAVAATIWNATVGNALRALWSLVQIVFNAWITIVTGVMNFLMPYISAAWNFISGQVRTALSQLMSIVSAVWNFIVSVISANMSTAHAIISAVWSAIVFVVRNAVAGVVAVINGISAIVGMVGRFFGQLRDAASGGVGSLLSFVGSIPGRVLGALGNLGGLLFRAGASIIQGLVDGIENMAGRVAGAVSGVLAKARALLPFSPAKEGPFSGKGWTLYSGQSMIKALAKGVLGSGSILNRALSSVLDRAKNTLGLTVAASGAPAGTSPSFLGFSGGGSTGASPTPPPAGPSVGQVNVYVPKTVVDPAMVANYTAKKVMTSLSTGTSGSVG